MRKAVVVGLLIVWLVVTPGLWSQDKDRAELAKAVAASKVSLEQGVSASALAGKPISAKFEIEDGKLQLSVYTAKGDTFSEVVVDHNTGKAVASRNSRQSSEGQPRNSRGKHLSCDQGW